MWLREIFNNELVNRCDKWSNYFDVYEPHLSKFVGKSPTVVEVGVAGGGSLEMWLKYFGVDSKIYGIDIHPQVEDVKGVQLIIGDQSNPEFWDQFTVDVPQIDVFIDDGSHVNSHQILTFYKVWQHLKEGGVYICEDTHTSYWNEYGGGLQRPGTFIEFAKQLIDCLHTDYMRDVSPSKNFYELTKDIGQVCFYDSQVVIVKGKKKNERIIKNGA